MNIKMEQMKSGSLDRLFRWGWFGLLAWLVILVIGAGAQSLHTSGKAASAIREYKRIQTEAAVQKEDGNERIAKLRDKNLFVAPAEKAKLPQCAAILGDSALFGDQWQKVGDTVQGAKILSIGPNYVRVLFDEKEQNLVPFEVEVQYAAQGGQPGQGPQGGGRGMGGRGDRGDRGTRNAAAAPTGPPTGGRERMMMAPGAMEEMRRRVESMTPEQRQQMMERYQNASPE
ncbi:MAG: hypothetical protein JXB18_05750, partial [Sedimentisphaerales bacterium]|nr:hypothetical protein [Sedimentisphaerales bacterium]